MTDTPAAELYDDSESLEPTQIAEMTQEEKLTRLAAYQKLVNTGHQFGMTAYQNAIRLVHSIRARSVATNSRAKAAAKEKTAQQTFSLESLLSNAPDTPTEPKE